MEGCPCAKGLKFKCFTSPSPEQAHRSSSAAAKDSLEERDLSDPHEICYATINHGLKQKPTMTNRDHETEYAFVNMPAKKGTSTSHHNVKQKPNTTNSSHETEYAYINMPAKKVTLTIHQNNEYDYILIDQSSEYHSMSMQLLWKEARTHENSASVGQI